mgnify:CR=1 FL=1|jgi:hypothetical protein
MGAAYLVKPGWLMALPTVRMRRYDTRYGNEDELEFDVIGERRLRLSRTRPIFQNLLPVHTPLNAGAIGGVRIGE